VISGGGRIRGTHSGTPDAVEDTGAPLVSAHKGMARAFVQSTEIRTGSVSERELLRKITSDAGAGTSSRILDDASGIAPIVVQASSVGLAPATISIPVTGDADMLPLAVASASAARTAQLTHTMTSAELARIEGLVV